MKATFKAGRIFIVLACAAGVTPQPVMSDTITPNSFSDRVGAVDEAGSILFMEHKPHRLWGIVADGRLVREVILGRVLQCEPVGEVKGKATTNVARCYFGFTEKWPEGDFKDLSDYLIKTQVAKEFCAESLGYYETCGDSILETK
jgi:hypothetical protein